MKQKNFDLTTEYILKIFIFTVTQLLFNNPNIYAKSLTDEVKEQLNEDAQSIFSKKPALITKEPFQRETELRSLGGVKFCSFAKDNQLDVGMY